MRITSDEHDIVFALLPFVGTVLGWSLSQRTSRAAGREQRRLEGDRRRDDRRMHLYQEMLAEIDRLMVLWDGASTADDASADEPYDAVAEAVTAQWDPRVRLFASPAVTELWQRWLDTYADRAIIELKFEKNPQNESDLNVVEQGLKLALTRQKLIAQMRHELEAWND